MIRPSRCRSRQPDAATETAEEHRSYTTSWDTIVLRDADAGASTSLAARSTGGEHQSLWERRLIAEGQHVRDAAGEVASRLLVNPHADRFLKHWP
jgi:hypothetical protein